MKVLFDIVHPAHALFFHHPILALQRRGDAVAIASREKDITTTVLDRLGHRHRPLTTAKSGLAGLLLELGSRDIGIWRLAHEFKPDVMVGFGGVAISHVGWLSGIPSISFYDTEIAKLQISITLPFITEWHVNEAYTGPSPKNREYRFPGPRQLSFFHPDNFKPDRARAIAAGLAEDEDNYLLRVVAWRANHDIGKQGWTASELTTLVDKLSVSGRVHISTEDELPPALEKFRYRGDVLDLHHLMAFCRAYIGESATMAAEAAVLGVPAIYAIPDYRGFVEQLANKGLIMQADGTIGNILQNLDNIRERDTEHWRRLRDEAVSQWINVSDYIVEAISRYRPKEEVKRLRQEL
jgi:predicted glycosyltransferase